jgi:hypothetical protein
MTTGNHTHDRPMVNWCAFWQVMAARSTEPAPWWAVMAARVREWSAYGFRPGHDTDNRGDPHSGQRWPLIVQGLIDDLMHSEEEYRTGGRVRAVP